MTDRGEFRLRVTILGRVQGVGFRAFVLQHAANLGLKGWVRNTYVGNVEVLAEGPRPDLEKLLSILEAGPRSSRIIEVKRQWESATGEFDHFAIQRTD